MSIIGLDFDGVIQSLRETKKGEFGIPVEGSLQAVDAFLRDGFEVLIYTARTDLVEVRRWLKEHGFPKMLVTNEKIPADIYVDDRGYRFFDWSNSTIDDIKELAGSKEVFSGGKIFR
jgi:hypothetical protein